MRVASKFFIFLISFFCLQLSATQAASLYIDPAFSGISRGDAVTLSVRLDVDEEIGECVNAADIVLNYSENISPVDVSLGDSIFNIWVEQPTIDTTNRTITLAGGTPNGYCGRVSGDPRLTNNIVTLVFRSPGFAVGSSNDAVNGSVSFGPETAVYLNDGFGTVVTPTTFGASIELDKSAGPVLVDPWREAIALDNIPPEEFSISLEKTRSAFGGRYFIVFNTTDKQTGIDQYQVMEEPASKFAAFEWGRADAPWVPARSPYRLEDQTLNSTIRVKAIDKAGNEYIATLVPNQELRSISTGLIVVVIGGGLIALILVAMLVISLRAYRKRRQSKSESATPDNQPSL